MEGVSLASIPQQTVTSFDKTVFPLVISPTNDESTKSSEHLLEFIQKNRAELTESLTKHGAFLIRGFSLENASDFDDAVNKGFAWDALPYVGGAAPRTSVIGTVFTTNESPPDSVIPFHHEMAQVPKYPQRLFFFCDVPPTKGGETPLCRSDVVYDVIKSEFPDFCEKLEKFGVIYTRTMPEEDDNESPIGRGWKSTYQTSDKCVVENKCAGLNVTAEWQPNGDLKTITAPLPAIKTHPVTGRKVWFNSIVAAYTGWKDCRNDPSKAVIFGDGSAMDGTIITRCLELMNEVCVDIPWQKGDMFVIDNEMVMHARRPFEPPRKIYAALCQL